VFVSLPADKHDVHLWQARHDADQAAAAAAAADPSHAQEADDALEAQLELMLQEGADGFEGGFDGLADDYVDIDEDGPADVYSDDEGSSDEEQQQRAGKRRGLAGKQRQQRETKRQKQAAAGPAAATARGSAAVPASVEPPPPSFSQVDMSLPEAELRRQFPRFPGVGAAQEVLLQVGAVMCCLLHRIASTAQLKNNSCVSLSMYLAALHSALLCYKQPCRLVQVFCCTICIFCADSAAVWHCRLGKCCSCLLAGSTK
jgi:hypothetical protein